jgi:glycosyltransferase involved in cell wall biosynthesis
LRRAGVTTVLANYGPTGVALSPVCRALGVGLVVHFHGYDAHRADVVSRHAAAYRNLGIEAVAVIAVSRHMTEVLVEAGIPEDRLHLTRCGVDPVRFAARSEPPTPPLFLAVGRFVDKKAHYLTLVAFAEARKAVPEARLVLAGEGELLEATWNLAKALGIEESVDFVGVLSPDEVAGWMQKATALVQHSITPRSGPNAGDSEGTPVSVLEAMMSGLPVIGTRHAGIGEVIEDGRTGLLVEERDTASMAAAMVRLAEDVELTRSMGRSARGEALANYSADRYIETLRSVLRGVA